MFMDSSCHFFYLVYSLHPTQLLLDGRTSNMKLIDSVYERRVLVVIGSSRIPVMCVVSSDGLTPVVIVVSKGII